MHFNTCFVDPPRYLKMILLFSCTGSDGFTVTTLCSVRTVRQVFPPSQLRASAPQGPPRRATRPGGRSPKPGPEVRRGLLPQESCGPALTRGPPGLPSRLRAPSPQAFPPGRGPDARGASRVTSAPCGPGSQPRCTGEEPEAQRARGRGQGASLPTLSSASSAKFTVIISSQL